MGTVPASSEICEIKNRCLPTQRGVGVETERIGAEVPVRWEMLKRESQSPGARLLRAKQSGEIAADGGKLAVV